MTRSSEVMPNRQFVRKQAKDIRSSYAYRPHDTVGDDEKVVYRNLFIVFSFVVIISGVLYLYGIDIVVGLSDFWRGAFPNQNIVSIDTKEPSVALVAPRIDSLPLYTKESTISVKGWAQPGIEVQVFANDSLVATILVDKNGRFEYSTVSLEEGENNLYTVSIKDGTTSSQSETYRVAKDTVAPILTVSVSDVVTDPSAKVTVSGSVDEKSIITINEQRVILHAENTFSSTISLSEGENKVMVKAVDLAGNESIEEFTKTVSASSTATPTP